MIMDNLNIQIVEADPIAITIESGGGSGEAPVTSVAGKIGAVTLVKGDVGLANVDNTSDLSKPISTATQTALDSKSATSHSHTVNDLSDATITTPADGQVLTYSAGTWVNAAASGGGGGSVLAAPVIADITAGVSIASGYGVFPFDIEVQDPDALYNNATYVYTCPTAGVYCISGSYHAGGVDSFMVRPLKNGAQHKRVFWNSFGSTWQAVNFSVDIKCAAGDTLQAGYYSNAAYTVDPQYCTLSIRQVS